MKYYEGVFVRTRVHHVNYFRNMLLEVSKIKHFRRTLFIMKGKLGKSVNGSPQTERVGHYHIYMTSPVPDKDNGLESQ